MMSRLFQNHGHTGRPSPQTHHAEKSDHRDCAAAEGFAIAQQSQQAPQPRQRAYGACWVGFREVNYCALDFDKGGRCSQERLVPAGWQESGGYCVR
jgi:hypothetical protein